MLDARSFSITFERSVRPAALVFVIGLHASVLLLSTPRVRSSDPSLVSVWLDLDVRSVDVDVKSLPETPRADIASAPPEDAHSERAPSVPAPDIAPPAAGIDWSLSGAVAAQATVEDLARREGYRPLGPRAQRLEAAAEAPSVYATPKHKLGDAELDPLNYDIVWHSDRCYTELGKPVTPRAEARTGFPNLMKCRLIGFGKKEPRGDLFEHLKRDRQPPREDED